MPPKKAPLKVVGEADSGNGSKSSTRPSEPAAPALADSIPIKPPVEPVIRSTNVTAKSATIGAISKKAVASKVYEPKRHSNPNVERGVKNLDQVMNSLYAKYNEKKRQVSEDEKELEWINSELARIQPRLQEVDRLLDEQLNKKAAIKAQIEQGKEQVHDTVGSMTGLMKKLKAKEKEFSAAKSLDIEQERGYSYKTSVKDIRKGVKTTIRLG